VPAATQTGFLQSVYPDLHPVSGVISPLVHPLPIAMLAAQGLLSVRAFNPSTQHIRLLCIA
jgi:hypothetical protein